MINYWAQPGWESQSTAEKKPNQEHQFKKITKQKALY